LVLNCHSIASRLLKGIEAFGQTGFDRRGKDLQKSKKHWRLVENLDGMEGNQIYVFVYCARAISLLGGNFSRDGQQPCLIAPSHLE
jgi:hypothetical protein